MEHCDTIGNGSLENWVLVGSGGFGFVYSADHKDLGKVAIKLISNDDGSYADLCREAHYMEAADQQYVPMVHGMYKGCPPLLTGSQERQGIVMELMEGGSLQKLLQTLSKPPPWPLVFRLAHQVALAMDFLHRKNDLVHMDLKPDNILLDAKLNAKIADFGLSTVSHSVLDTSGGHKGGTLAFIPPEAFDDKYHRSRSYDVYSYAIVLWTILTGDKPYSGLGAGQHHSLVELRIQQGDRPELDNIDKLDVHQAAGLNNLVELMKRCWDSDPKKRPSFTECIEVTGPVFSRHEEGIDAAVSEIQTFLEELKPLEGPPVHVSCPPVLQVHVSCPPGPPVHVSRPPGPPAHVSRPLAPPGSKSREDLLRHVCDLTLDPNTAASCLSLSENNMKVTWVRQDQKYPDHSDRFKSTRQVMCRERLTGRCYREIDWSGGVTIAVTYRGIDRQGYKGLFGYNDKSWSLGCDSDNGSYTVRHNKEEIVLPVRRSSCSGRVAVYLDWPAGTVSFYTVSSDTLTHLHTFESTFTEPLYAGFRCRGAKYETSVSLCVR